MPFLLGASATAGRLALAESAVISYVIRSISNQPRRGPNGLIAPALCIPLLWGALTENRAAVAEPADLFQHAAPVRTLTVDHSPWTRLLKAYVRPSADGINRVDYQAFKRAGHAGLKRYISSIEAVDPTTLDRSGQFALLVNLYNAKTIDIILDHYPVKSIKDISLGGGFLAAIGGGPWKAKVLTLRGSALSLDDIEHGILRPLFKDARVHYAVNCASIGCPNLQPEAFSGSKLGAQLDAAARAYVNHPRGTEASGDTVMASRSITGSSRTSAAAKPAC
jgi:hypothetical protein